MGNVYVSYRGSDATFARFLADHLRQRLNRLDNIQLSHDSNWENDIRQSDVLVLIVTAVTFDPEAINQTNDRVRREIAFALRQHKPIALAIVDNVAVPANLPADIQAVASKPQLPVQSAFPETSLDKLAYQLVSIARARIALRQTAPRVAVPSNLNFNQMTHMTLQPSVSFATYADKKQASMKWVWLLVACLILLGTILLLSGSLWGGVLLAAGAFIFI